MLHRSMEQGLSASCGESLRTLIRERTGIVIQNHQRRQLSDTVTDVSARLGYENCDALVRALAKDGGNTREMQLLISGITVGESYFFRDQDQFDWLRGQYLPKLIDRKRESGELNLRIWSAGCSEGQEIYSITILLHELLSDIGNWNLHLLGTDINTQAQSQALRGRYSDWSFRTTPDAMRNRYFRPVASEWELLPELRRLIKLDYLNLSQDHFPSILGETNALDLILCRNVFIYLEPDTIRAVMKKFSASLVADGMLLLGAADMVETHGTDLEPVQAGPVFYYHRVTDRTGADNPAPLPGGWSPPVADSQPPQDVPGKTRRRHPQALPSATKRTQERAKPTQRRRHSPTEQTVLALYRDERWQELIDTVDAALTGDNDSPLLRLHKATALANLGHLEAAANLCERCIRELPTDKHAYLLKGLVQTEQGHREQAEQAFRKALFLDRGCVEAHYQLGMLLLHGPRRQAGLKSLGNALRLARAGNSDMPIHNAPGMTYGRLAQILREELKIYGASDQ